MKNGYTHKEYAYSIAVDALYRAYRHDLENEGLSSADLARVKQNIEKLYYKLADAVKFDVSPLQGK